MMATVPLSQLQALHVELRAWQETAKREREARQQAEALVEQARSLIADMTRALRAWQSSSGDYNGTTDLMIQARRLLADPTGARLAEEQRALADAINPFLSGGEWGTWKAYMVHGPETKEHGIAAAKQITAWQVALDAAVERARGGQG